MIQVLGTVRRWSRLLEISFCIATGIGGARCACAQDTFGAPGESVTPLTAIELQAFLDPLLRSQLAERRIAGAVVIVVADGELLFGQGYGYADVAARRPMDIHTPVRIASITKTLTALSVLQLAEAGELDLDRDVNGYIDFVVPAAADGSAVTLRRLLSHRTRFEDRLDRIGAWSGERPPLGPFLARRVPRRLHAQDEAVSYSNFNASLAAYVVERASGKSFEQYLNDHLFRPLEMARSTAVQPVPAPLSAEVASGYLRSDWPPTRESMAAATIYEVGSTGVIASGADMARLMIALLDADPRIVSRASLATMMSAQSGVPYGFVGLGVYSPVGAGGNAFVGHDGGTGGFGSTLALSPERRLGLFASYNSQGSPTRIPAYAELLQRFAERYLAESKPRSSARTVADVSGTYQPARRTESSLFKLRALFGQVTVERAASGSLMVAGTRLEEIEPGLFRGAGLELAFSEAGTATILQIGAPVAAYVPVPWWTSARFVVPSVGVCLIVAAIAVLASPIAWLRRRAPTTDRTARSLKLASRSALLMNTAAIVAALWLVLFGWPLAAVSFASVAPLVAGIYVAGWTGVLLAPFAVWHAFRFARRRAGGVFAIVREIAFAIAAAALATFCLYARIAGTPFGAS